MKDVEVSDSLIILMLLKFGVAFDCEMGRREITGEAGFEEEEDVRSIFNAIPFPSELLAGFA